jgi:hypothetical protein
MRSASRAKLVSRNTARSGLRAAISFTRVIGNASFETGDQRIAVDRVDGLAMQGFTVDRQGQFHAPVDQHLEQQILGGAIWLHAIDLTEQLVLLHRVRAIVDVGHVRTVNFQDAEANVAIPAFSAISCNDPSTSAADALLCHLRQHVRFAEFVEHFDGILHRLLCGSGGRGNCLIQILRQLHAYEAVIGARSCIGRQDGLGRAARACKKVHDDRISVPGRRVIDKLGKLIMVLRIAEDHATHKCPKIFHCHLRLLIQI